jgi:uncharacterized protein YjbI with pentapeptide repeats
MRYANCVGTKFHKAVLRNADLGYADFTMADLRETDFRGANIEGAKFAGANVEGAKFDGEPPVTKAAG